MLRVSVEFVQAGETALNIAGPAASRWFAVFVTWESRPTRDIVMKRR